jgi:hypothetical protein
LHLAAQENTFTSSSSYLSKRIHIPPDNSSKFATSKANQLNMFGHSRIVYFAAFLALLAPALANVYRMDFRSPKEIQDDEGFVARDPDGDGSVIDHVKNKLGDDDPWVSTTTDYSVAKGKDRSTNPIFETFADHTSFFLQEAPYPPRKSMSTTSQKTVLSLLTPSKRSRMQAKIILHLERRNGQ